MRAVRTLPYNIRWSTLTSSSSSSSISSTNLALCRCDSMMSTLSCRLIQRLLRIPASICMIFSTSSSLKTPSHVDIRMLWGMQAAWMNP